MRRCEDWSVPSLVSPVLVGRQDESRALAEALVRALDGQPAAVVVGGEAGVGKSRLVQELVGRARAAGARVLIGGCVELDGGGIPFAPLVDMLRALAAELTPERELDALLGPARAEIGRLVPELDDGAAGPAGAEPRPADPRAAARRRLRGWPGETPLMLVFEDVQWADRLDARPDRAARRRRRRAAAAAGASPSARTSCTARTRSAAWPRAGSSSARSSGWSSSASDARDVAGADRGDPRRAAGRASWSTSSSSARRASRCSSRSCSARSATAGWTRTTCRRRCATCCWPAPSGSPPTPSTCCGSPRPPRAGCPSGCSAPGRRALRRPSSTRRCARRSSSSCWWSTRPGAATASGMRWPGPRSTRTCLPGERARLHSAYAEALEASAELAGRPRRDRRCSPTTGWPPTTCRARSRVGARRSRRRRATAPVGRPAALRAGARAVDPGARRRASAPAIDHAAAADAAADAAHRPARWTAALALVDQALDEVGHGGALERRAQLLVRRATILTDLGRDEEGLAVLEQAVGLAPGRALRAGPARTCWGRSPARCCASTRSSGPASSPGARSRRRRGGRRARGGDRRADHARACRWSTRATSSAGWPGGRGRRPRRAGAGLPWIATRAYVNLSDVLLMLGRYDEAVADRRRGHDAGRAGRARAHRGRVHCAATGPRRCCARAAGTRRWPPRAPGGESPGVFAGALLLVRAELTLLSGTRDRGARPNCARRGASCATPRARSSRSRSPGSRRSSPAATGDLDGAPRDRGAGARASDSGEEPRYRWPLMSLARGSRPSAHMAARDAGRARTPTTPSSTAACAEAEAMAARTPADRGQLAAGRAPSTHGSPATAKADAWDDAVEACRADGRAVPARLRAARTPRR